MLWKWLLTTGKEITMKAFNALQTYIVAGVIGIAVMALPQIAQAQLLTANSLYALNLMGADTESEGGHQAGFAFIGYVETNGSGEFAADTPVGLYTVNDNGALCEGIITDATLTEEIYPTPSTISFTEDPFSPNPLDPAAECLGRTFTLSYNTNINSATVNILTVSALGFTDLLSLDIGAAQATTLFVSTQAPVTLPASGTLVFNDPSGNVGSPVKHSKHSQVGATGE
jgi:hypothetical protein